MTHWEGGRRGQYGTAQDREFQVGVDWNTKKGYAEFDNEKKTYKKINTHKCSHEMPSNSGMKKSLSQEKKNHLDIQQQKGKWARLDETLITHTSGIRYFVFPIGLVTSFPSSNQKKTHTSWLIIINSWSRNKKKRNTSFHTRRFTNGNVLLYIQCKKRFPRFFFGVTWRQREKMCKIERDRTTNC